MCGICGYILKEELPDVNLEIMNNTMIKRGPDDKGIYTTKLNDGNFLGLAQRRLSILDLTELGHQPMFSNNRQIVVVFNGEIYNYQQIRKELKSKGYRFISNCDTEVIVNGYLEYGEKILNKLNGMFVIALYDFSRQQLLLARDRIGKKPLYYYWENGNLVFASELKPLMKCPIFKKEINCECISGYLTNRYIAAPNTIFKETYKVEPGQYIIWKNNQLDKHTFWNILDAYKEGNNRQIYDYSECINTLKKLVFDSVEKRLISDVPVGLFLSRGIDSVLLAAVAKEIRTEIQTYTIGFFDQKQNEAVEAKKIAEYLGTQHKEMYISDLELQKVIPDLPKAFDEPLGDPSAIAQMLVAKMAKEDITVALSGTGGDEVFCGYKMYDWLYTIQQWSGLINIIRNATDLPGIRQLPLLDSCSPRVRAILNSSKTTCQTQLFNTYREECAQRMVLREGNSSINTYENKIPETNWQLRRMILDLRTYVPDEILAVADRSSMWYSMEVRAPLLDYRILEYSFHIPHKYKYKKREKKYILKDLLYTMVPRDYLNGPKHGFSAPIDCWLNGPLKQDLMRVSTERVLNRQGIFSYNYIDDMINKLEKSNDSIYSSLLWCYYVFQLWYETYIEELI